MKRFVLTLALSLGWASGSAAQVADQPPSAALEAAIPPGDTLDTVKTWPLQINGDTWQDYLVQAARTPGGNAWYLQFYLMVGFPGDMFQVYELPQLDGGIRDVSPVPGGVNLTLYRYLDGDPRCCPSGSTSVHLDLSKFGGG